MRDLNFLFNDGSRFARQIYTSFYSRVNTNWRYDWLNLSVYADGLKINGVNDVASDSVFIKWADLPNFVNKKLRGYENA